jgi:hypothetical protein
VSHAATSPALSDREKYPTFYRLAQADSSHNAARKTFIRHFEWDKVATIQQDEDTYTLVCLCVMNAPNLKTLPSPFIPRRSMT